MSKRIYDCFLFFNELDLLRLRLDEMESSVYRFVICEATRTFKGQPKPLIFQENKTDFVRYQDRIIHLVVDDLPDGSAWDREYFQRNALRRGLQGIDDNDIVLVSDVDEIVGLPALERLRSEDGYFLLDMSMYQFYMNMRAFSEGWDKVFAYSWYLDALVPDYNHPRNLGRAAWEAFPGPKHLIKNAGWHFTYLGGAERMREKIKAYSHSDQWQSAMLIAGEAEKQMLILKDVGGGRFLTYQQIDETFPAAIRQNPGRFIDLGLVLSSSERIRNLEMALSMADLENRALIARASRAEAAVRYETAETDRLQSFLPAHANLARNKPATQSSVSQWSHSQHVEEDAAGAVNGLITGHYGFHTDLEDAAWWQVDLENLFSLREIRIFNRRDQAGRLLHFSILGSVSGIDWSTIYMKTDDTVFGQSDWQPFVAHLSGEMVRFVRIQQNEREFLHFDECLIYGSPTDPREALWCWTAVRRRFPLDRLVQVRLFEARMLMLGADPAMANHVDTDLVMADDQRMRAVMMSFESLGGARFGCEFGGVQRAFGAEPLGLLRWADIAPEDLIGALEAKFEGVGLPENTELFTYEAREGLEYGTRDTRFHMAMHTFVQANSMPADRLLQSSCARLQYLRRKIVQDLESATKIFVYRLTYDNLTCEQLSRLHAAIRAYGPSTLLYVRYSEPTHPNGTVEAVRPGLLVGYLDNFGASRDDKPLALPIDWWATICTAAHELWRPHEGEGTPSSSLAS